MRIESSIRKSRADALEKIDVEACEASGGKVEEIGMFGIPACVAYYSDGGKPCNDNAQCEGNCYDAEILEEGTVAQGICESSEHDSFGCFSRIENGVVSSAICQD